MSEYTYTHQKRYERCLSIAYLVRELRAPVVGRDVRRVDDLNGRLRPRRQEC